MVQETTAITHLEALHFLIGSWETTGEIQPEAENKGTIIRGTDIYELVLGGHFILHQADVIMDNKRVTVIEMIGEYDPIDESWQMRSFDNQGLYSLMKASLKEDYLQITGNNMRARLSKSEDAAVMFANWEKSEDGETWEPWMELKFTR